MNSVAGAAVGDGAGGSSTAGARGRVAILAVVVNKPRESVVA